MKKAIYIILAVLLMLLPEVLRAAPLSYYENRFSFNLPEQVTVVSQNQDDCLFQAVCGNCKVFVRHYSAEAGLLEKKSVLHGDDFLFVNLRVLTETYRARERVKRADKAKVGHARYTDSRGDAPVYYESYTFVKDNNIVCILAASPDGDFTPAQAVVNAFQYGPVKLKERAKKGVWASLVAAAPYLLFLVIALQILLGEVFFRHVAYEGGWKDVTAWVAVAVYCLLTGGLLYVLRGDKWFFLFFLCFSLIWLLLCFLAVVVPGVRRFRDSFAKIIDGILGK